MSDEGAGKSAGADEAANASGRVNIEQFAALDLRVAQILEAEAHPKADKLLVLKIDVGDEQPRQLVAGIKAFRSPEELVGKTIIVVANLEPAKLRGVESQGMMLAAGGKNDAPFALVTVDTAVPPGTRIS